MAICRAAVCFNYKELTERLAATIQVQLCRSVLACRSSKFIASLKYIENATTFQPKLTFIVDTQEGFPIDAWLSPETRGYLQQLSRHRSASDEALGFDEEAAVAISRDKVGTPNGDVASYDTAGELANALVKCERQPQLQMGEVPLTSDSEFFQILNRELIALEKLQEHEQKRLTQEVVALGHNLSTLSKTDTKRGVTDLSIWREILRLYIESEVFFSTGERDRGMRDSSSVQQRLQDFQTALSRQKHAFRLKRDGKTVLEHFMSLNLELLKNLKFQEINRMALTKIMKSMGI